MTFPKLQFFNIENCSSPRSMGDPTFPAVTSLDVLETLLFPTAQHALYLDVQLKNTMLKQMQLPYVLLCCPGMFLSVLAIQIFQEVSLELCRRWNCVLIILA